MPNTAAAALRGLTLRNRPDADLFDRALGGDAVAFSEIYRRYQRTVYAFCLARLMSPEQAADAAQEVFLRLLRTKPGKIESPSAWLFTVARNVCVDAIRSQARTPAQDELDEELPALNRLAANDSADAILSHEDAHTIFLALRKLRPRYRAALIMREIHGQSSADIAEAMSMTPAAVDTLVCRARDSFGKAYADVTEFPQACRDAITVLYRRTGTGISKAEQDSLTLHLKSCARCRREAAKAGDQNHLPALLPFLVASQAAGRSIFADASLAMRTAPRTLLERLPWLTELPQLSPLAQKAIMAGVAATIVIAPLAGKIVVDQRSREAARARATVQTRESARAAPRPQQEEAESQAQTKATAATRETQRQRERSKPSDSSGSSQHSGSGSGTSGSTAGGSDGGSGTGGSTAGSTGSHSPGSSGSGAGSGGSGSSGTGSGSGSGSMGDSGSGGGSGGTGPSSGSGSGTSSSGHGGK